MDPIELHPIYTRASVEKSAHFSNLQNYANVLSEINANQLKEKIKREQSSPKVVEKTSSNLIKNSTEKNESKNNQFYNKEGKKNKNKEDIVKTENNHILDVRIWSVIFQ